jgi:hypothetical protein
VPKRRAPESPTSAETQDATRLRKQLRLTSEGIIALC